MLRKIEESGNILEKNFKIKPLTKEQIKISLDRLTRFKPTEEKYLRVFKEIILSNLISPKYNKKQLEAMDYQELTRLFEEIFNYSLNLISVHPRHAELTAKSIEPEAKSDFMSLTGVSASFQFSEPDRSRNKFGMTKKETSINKKLLQYEKSIFKFDKNVEKLLDNKIDYQAAINLFQKPGPLNLKWLKSLSENINQIEFRANFGLKFPIEKIILVEGVTEEILLPKFALLCGLDFDKAGINLISAGGKNQVVRLFYKYAEILKLPIFVLLDKDGEANFDEIKPKLRKKDKVHVIRNGEFEDILPLNLIKRTLNKEFDYFPVLLKDLRKDLPMTQILEEIFKKRGSEFKKAEFASMLRKNLQTKKDVSDEIESIISEIS